MSGLYLFDSIPMKQMICGLLMLVGLTTEAQQLLLEGFGAWNRTNYSLPEFSTPTSFFSYGGRLGVGADRLQLGAEYRSNLTNAKFNENAKSTSFEETFYGGFVRTKISRYPAMRFGLVLRAGAGVHQTKAIFESGALEVSEKYDPILGFNGGVGFSIPTFSNTMLELGYTYNYLSRPALKSDGVTLISKHDGSYHMISLGLSLNFVFGETAKRYEHARENRRFQNGWRG